jgi:hypothetical protein
MRLSDKNSFVHGILVGIAVPLLSLGIIKGILYILSLTLNENYNDWRLRTISLIAICANFIPFQFHKKNYNDESMRGITIPTIIFGITWVFIYRQFIFGE